ncbi:hypothetical protein ASD04_07180 [Devosia sp. Root436]|uniref:hypothetical protein n=1 Tax=Devosia sp. Root436 TaxID=1736537 RepID=UPI0006F1C695|nr:hypothetical protein [Devosia sp. Root436]KQX40401.1 hypothetical protein ASD04_07180 [Devosia sp. Root436]
MGLLDTPDARAIYRPDVTEFESVEAANEDVAKAPDVRFYRVAMATAEWPEWGGERNGGF